MIKSATSKFLLFAAVIAVSGCQLTDITKAECKSDETTCLKGNIHTCNSRGFWSDKPTETCDKAGCSEGTIQAASNPLTCYECGTDEARCEGNKLIACSNHKEIKTECEYGCVTTETNAYCRECKADEKKCEKGFIVSCTKDGEKKGKWDNEHKQSCENGCFPGARGNGSEVSCYECGDADKLKCFRDDETKVTTIKRCLAHNWYDEEVCALSCVEGTEAKCKLCNNNDKKYYNNEDGYCVEQECKDNQYQDVKTADVSCNSDLSEFGDCLNGSVKCKDNGNGNGEGTFQFCMNGSWNNFGKCDPNDECSILDKGCAEYNKVGQICENQKLVACPNNASCKPDFSGCAECQNGTSKCENNQVVTCKDGEYIPTSCETGKHCDIFIDKNTNKESAQCVQNECENDQQHCQGNIIQKCDNYKWTNISACEKNEQCKESNGKAACSCISGTAYCDDTTAKNCKDGQWQTTACGQNKSCAMIGDEAKCIECESGTKCKDNSSIMTCQNNAWSDATPCSDGMTCTGDDGNAKCVCTEGQAVCASDKTKIKKCKADGAYGSAKSCGTGKHCEGVAGSAVCTADPMECSPGAAQCDGNNLKTCSSKGKWETQTCEKGCSNMACNECNDGEDYYTDENELNHKTAVNCIGHKWITTDCYPNLSKKRDDLKKAICIGNCKVDGLVYCEEEGLARYRCTNEVTYPNDPAYDHSEPIYFPDGVCECDDPGVKERCSSNNGQDVLQICNVDAEWEDKQNCYICQNDICYPDCAPGTQECDGDITKSCTPNGVWEEKKCEIGCNPKSGSCYPECLPKTTQCANENTLKKCNNEGQWKNENCEYGCAKSVIPNACYPKCRPGTKQCFDKRLKTCKIGGNGWDVGQACQACFNNTCLNNLATNQIYCDDNKSPTYIGVVTSISPFEIEPLCETAVECKNFKNKL